MPNTPPSLEFVASREGFNTLQGVERAGFGIGGEASFLKAGEV